MEEKEVKVTLITIGDELLIGQTVDTNSVWMSQQLIAAGFWVERRIAIADDPLAIKNTLREESKSADVILMTGGLGPTDDDQTKGVLSDYFDAPLEWDEQVLEQVKKRLAHLGGTFLARNKEQALVPNKGQVLFNERGTAPGLWFDEKGTIFVAMPGIPFEMKGLMKDKVIPKLLTHFRTPAILHRTWIVSGVPESTLAESLRSFERSLPPHISLAYLPDNGMLKLRLTAKGSIKQKLAHELDQYGSSLENKVRKYLLIIGDIPLQKQVGEELRRKGLSVATAESCTGGFIGHLFTAVPGSSDYFQGAVVTYSNEMKHQLLGVSKNTLSKKGAVSEEVVRKMLEGVLKKLDTDVGIAVSGIMGPGGGSAEKPVGTAWIAAGNDRQLYTRKLQLRYDRKKNIILTANYALILLLEAIKDIGK